MKKKRKKTRARKTNSSTRTSKRSKAKVDYATGSADDTEVDSEGDTKAEAEADDDEEVTVMDKCPKRFTDEYHPPKLLAFLSRAPLEQFVVDPEHYKGRAIRTTGETNTSIKEKGWKGDVAFVKCIEIPWTEKTWKDYLNSQSTLGMSASMPKPLKELLFREHTLMSEEATMLNTKDFFAGSESRIIDLTTDSEQHTKFQLDLRRFLVVDGNHRMFTLQEMLKTTHAKRVPSINNVSLLDIDFTDLQGLIQASAYYNALKQHQDGDNIVDRMLYTKGLVDLYKSTELHWPRNDDGSYTEPPKEPKESKRKKKKKKNKKNKEDDEHESEDEGDRKEHVEYGKLVITDCTKWIIEKHGAATETMRKWTQSFFTFNQTVRASEMWTRKKLTRLQTLLTINDARNHQKMNATDTQFVMSYANVFTSHHFLRSTTIQENDDIWEAILTRIAHYHAKFKGWTTKHAVWKTFMKELSSKEGLDGVVKILRYVPNLVDSVKAHLRQLHETTPEEDSTYIPYPGKDHDNYNPVLTPGIFGEEYATYMQQPDCDTDEEEDAVRAAGRDFLLTCAAYAKGSWDPVMLKFIVGANGNGNIRLVGDHTDLVVKWPRAIQEKWKALTDEVAHLKAERDEAIEIEKEREARRKKQETIALKKRQAEEKAKLLKEKEEQLEKDKAAAEERAAEAKNLLAKATEAQKHAARETHIAAQRIAANALDTFSLAAQESSFAETEATQAAKELGDISLSIEALNVSDSDDESDRERERQQRVDRFSPKKKTTKPTTKKSITRTKGILLTELETYGNTDVKDSKNKHSTSFQTRTNDFCKERCSFDNKDILQCLRDRNAQPDSKKFDFIYLDPPFSCFLVAPWDRRWSRDAVRFISQELYKCCKDSATVLIRAMDPEQATKWNEFLAEAGFIVTPTRIATNDPEWHNIKCATNQRPEVVVVHWFHIVAHKTRKHHFNDNKRGFNANKKSIQHYPHLRNELKLYYDNGSLVRVCENHEGEVDAILRRYCPKGAHVGDFCGGTGTTAMVALKRGYTVVYNDKDPEAVKCAQIRVKAFVMYLCVQNVGRPFLPIGNPPAHTTSTLTSSNTRTGPYAWYNEIGAGSSRRFPLKPDQYGIPPSNIPSGYPNNESSMHRLAAELQLAVKQSGIIPEDVEHNRGLFALADFPAFSVIDHVVGRYKKRVGRKRKTDSEVGEEYVNTIQLDDVNNKSWFMEVSRFCPANYANDPKFDPKTEISSPPESNVEFVELSVDHAETGRLVLRTTRVIASGDEILVDYHLTEHGDSGKCLITAGRTPDLKKERAAKNTRKRKKKTAVVVSGGANDEGDGPINEGDEASIKGSNDVSDHEPSNEGDEARNDSSQSVSGEGDWPEDFEGDDNTD
jgi:16S rRNA G966 N2-methylase RsmD